MMVIVSARMASGLNAFIAMLLAWPEPPTQPTYPNRGTADGVAGKSILGRSQPRIEYLLPVARRRESPIRRRRLRLDEALLERALMSPVGYRFLPHLAPRIDR